MMQRTLPAERAGREKKMVRKTKKEKKKKKKKLKPPEGPPPPPEPEQAYSVSQVKAYSQLMGFVREKKKEKLGSEPLLIFEKK